jgi:hypothetical protein
MFYKNLTPSRTLLFEEYKEKWIIASKQQYIICVTCNVTEENALLCLKLTNNIHNKHHLFLDGAESIPVTC